MSTDLRVLGCCALVAVLSACSMLKPDPAPGAVDPNAPAGLPHFAKVDDGLYRSGQPTAEGFAAAERMGIRTVVSLRSSHNDRPLLEGTHLRYVQIACHQWSMNEEEVAAFLKVATDPAMRPVLVHCAEGRDRTGLAVAAYRVSVNGWSHERAQSEMRTFGPCPLWPNLGRCLRRLDPGTAAAH